MAKETNNRWYWTVVVGIIAYMAGGFFNPWMEHYGGKALSKFIDPDVELRCESILLTKSRTGEVPNVKLKYIVRNHDETDRTVALKLLSATNAGLTADVPMSPIRLEGLGIHYDSIDFPAPTLRMMFRLQPTIRNQQWTIEYEVGDQKTEYSIALDTAEITKLSYLLTPSDSFAMSNLGFWEFFHTTPATFVDTVNGVATLSHDYYLYNVFVAPTEAVELGVDSNYDNVADWFPGVNDLGKDFPGRVSEITFDCSIYSRRVAGFVIGVKENHYPRDSMFFEQLIGSGYEKMYSNFGAIIDPRVKLADQFIYIRFRM